MAKRNFRINRKGGSEVLKVLSRDMINDLARQIASAAGEDAVVTEYTTDRAAASVSVPVEQQAKDGVLTKAVASVGLEVRS